MINFTTLFKKDNSAEKLESVSAKKLKSVENAIERFLRTNRKISKKTKRHLECLLTIIKK